MQRFTDSDASKTSINCINCLRRKVKVISSKTNRTIDLCWWILKSKKGFKIGDLTTLEQWCNDSRTAMHLRLVLIVHTRAIQCCSNQSFDHKSKNALRISFADQGIRHFWPPGSGSGFRFKIDWIRKTAENLSDH